MHWYDKYIKEHKQSCLECGWKSVECDGDCEACDEFQQDLADFVGANERVWPYDYLTQEEYEEACQFANDADEIISGEAVCWWSGIGGTFVGISSPAIDPRDYINRKDYKDALYHHLFAEAVSHHPSIPCNELWYRVFVEFLEDSESAFCAEKSTANLLDELMPDVDGTGLDPECYLPTDLDIPQVRYSSFDPSFDTRERYFAKHYGRYPIRWFMKPEYTVKQFRNDLFRNYPNLYLLIHYAIRKEDFETEKDMAVKEYLMAIFSNALFLNDLFGFDVEECVQNGLVGFLNARRNSFWQEHLPSWIWEYDSKERHHQYLLWEIRLHMIQYSMELENFFGFMPTRQMTKAIDAVIRGYASVHNLSSYIYSSEPRYWADDEYAQDQVKKFFGEQKASKSPPLSDEVEDVNIEGIYLKEVRTALRKMIDLLPDRQKEILISRYGLNGNEALTLDEVGHNYGITRERVRQIEKKAIEHLRKMEGFAGLCELTDHPIPVTKEIKDYSSEELEALPLKAINIRMSIRSTLERWGKIQSVGELLRLSLDELRSIPFIRDPMVGEILEAVEQAGLSFVR